MSEQADRAREIINALFEQLRAARSTAGNKVIMAQVVITPEDLWLLMSDRANMTANIFDPDKGKILSVPYVVHDARTFLRVL